MVFVPCLNARWVYRNLPLEVWIAQFRFVVHCCSFGMPATQTRVQQLTAYLIHLASAGSLQDGDLVGEFIAEWAICSPLTHCQFAVAVRSAQLSSVREIQQGFRAALARSTSPLGACPPGEHIGSQGHGYQLGMGIVAAPRCQPTELCRMIEWLLPLTCIVRGDGYPCADGEWSQLSVSIACIGLRGRIPACVWVIGLAICGDKAMATLATSRKPILRCAAYTPCCSGDVPITCSGDVPATFKFFVGTVTGTIWFQQN